MSSSSLDWAAWPARLDKWLRVSVRRHLLDEHLASLDIDFGATVLEIGAGRDGRRGDYVPPVKGARSWVQLDLRTQARPHLLSDLQRLPLAANAFDSVLCLEVLQYLNNPGQGLREVHRALRPGGLFVLAVPFLHRADTDHDYWRFTEPGLRYLLAEAGFQVFQVKAQGAAFAVAVNILKFALHNLKRGRLFWGLLFRPLLNGLWRLDAMYAQRFSLLASFSTGHLMLARLPEKESVP